jgi:hypothetical protein
MGRFHRATAAGDEDDCDWSVVCSSNDDRVGGSDWSGVELVSEPESGGLPKELELRHERVWGRSYLND